MSVNWDNPPKVTSLFHSASSAVPLVFLASSLLIAIQMLMGPSVGYAQHYRQHPQSRTQNTADVRTAQYQTNQRESDHQTARLPAHLRQVSHQAPIVGGHTSVNTRTASSRFASHGAQVVGGDTYFEGELIDDGYAVGGETYFDEGYVDGGCGCDSCDTCVDDGGCVGGFCSNPNRGVCGCGDFRNCDICRECWLRNAGGLICNTEAFIGAHSFDSVLEPARGTNFNDFPGQFGFHGGVNIGLPLRRLTCGIVSGQIGASIHQSEYGGDGGVFSNETREQVFLTTGLFRRVDYGLQFGVVYDMLFEDWFYRAELGQMRGELSYVMDNGGQFGLRFAKGIQDGEPTGFGFTPDVLDNYRFFLRAPSFNGQGFVDLYYGFTDESHSLVGAETDIGLTPRVGIQSGFTYVWDDEVRDDGYNMYMRLVFRPAGANWYDNYHRPLLPVADNGSLLMIHR